jgi:hypothetical protein
MTLIAIWLASALYGQTPAAVAAEATSRTALSDQLVRNQAVQCGLEPDRIFWVNDAAGKSNALIDANTNAASSVSPETLRCMSEWVSTNRAPVSFVASPPPIQP